MRDADDSGALQSRAGLDFKGWFFTRDGERCDPLTVSDLHSRCVLKAEALSQATTRWTMQAFRALFRRHGLPEIIRVDNGAPFASGGPGGLSKLSVWWIGLGIKVQFAHPGCPQDNGCHERMHRTMKAECCRPPSANLSAQQQRFDRWRKEFNEERPHEALGMRRPAEVYQASARRLDGPIKPRLYEPGVDTERVSTAGFIALNGLNCYVGNPSEEWTWRWSATKTAGWCWSVTPTSSSDASRNPPTPVSGLRRALGEHACTRNGR